MIVILVPVLRRPHRVEPLLESITAATTVEHRVLFICSPDDTAEHEAIDQAAATFLTAERISTPEPYPRGDYARKINLGIRATWEPNLFLAADDLHFHEQWAERAIGKLSDTVEVVGTNDLGNRRVMRGMHSTHTLVTRRYVEQRGTIDELGKALHEGYWHEYVDDEFVQTAKHRGAFAFAADSIVEHLHPSWGKAPMDPLYEQQAQRMRVGRRIFELRSPLWT